jgi:putative transposase
MTVAKWLTGLGCAACRVCDALSMPRSTYYRSLGPRSAKPSRPRPRPANRLSEGEVQAIKDVLHEERFIDLPPREIVPTLADEGRYLASIRTFYRVLAGLGESNDRRLQARHPRRSAPILEATGPNQVWSWDITRLKGPWRGKFFFLYVMIDIFTRYVVGWMVSERENARRAQGFIRETVNRHLAPGHKLTIHNDRGSPMKAGGTMDLIKLLGLEHSFSRPRTSDDNPYSEAQFRTLKYHSRFPAFFESSADAEEFLTRWFRWYNYEHRHTGLNLHTPASVHYGDIGEVVERRKQVMDAAFARNPNRFPNGRPVVKSNPSIVGINLMYRTTPVQVEASLSGEAMIADSREGIYTN